MKLRSGARLCYYLCRDGQREVNKYIICSLYLTYLFTESHSGNKETAFMEPSSL